MAQQESVSGIQQKLPIAFAYVLKHERILRIRYAGYISMINGLDERVIPPFAIGKKNWLFLARMKGAESSVCVYIIIETVKVNGINPYKYKDITSKYILCLNT